MVKKTHYSDRDQLSFADQFAAPDLYRNEVVPTVTLIATKISAKLKDGSRSTITCVERSQLSRADILMGLDTVPLCNDPQDSHDPLYIQRAIFYGDKIVVHPSRIDRANTPARDSNSLNNLTRGRFNGFISKSSGITIRKRLEAWIKAVQFNKIASTDQVRPKHSHIGFLTLTLPSDQMHSDNEIKRKCLMPFIQQLKRINSVQEYFWSAEPQKKGNLHFHLLIDRYVDKVQVNDLWNVATDHLGYLSRYVAETGDVRPPSTRIQACPQDMSLVKYVMKYVSKQPEIRCSLKIVNGVKFKRISYWTIERDSKGVIHEFERRPIEGRSWGMSKGISTAKVYSMDASYRVYDLLNIMKWDPAVKLLQMDHCEVYYTNVHDLLMRNDSVLLSDYRRHYVQLYRDLYYPKSEPELPDIPIIQFDPSPQPYVSYYSQGKLSFA